MPLRQYCMNSWTTVLKSCHSSFLDDNSSGLFSLCFALLQWSRVTILIFRSSMVLGILTSFPLFHMPLLSCHGLAGRSSTCCSQSISTSSCSFKQSTLDETPLNIAYVLPARRVTSKYILLPFYVLGEKVKTRPKDFVCMSFWYDIYNKGAS